MAAAALKNREWKKEVSGQDFLISTSIEKLDVKFINDSFETEEMFWAKRLPEENIRLMLSQSLTLGLYKVQPAALEARTVDSPSSPRTPSPTVADTPQEQLQQIGLARIVTDYTTIAYMTDVFVLKDYRGLDLGKWLAKCCRECMETFPNMRRALLLTSPDVGKKFYSRELGFWDAHEERDHLAVMTRKAYATPGEKP